ncbi:uncharacterized protein ASPGLDRAFT_538626 [Aspergillus glaucus CBS 516.65]|uniref:Uncharacterized protein n=1 Tax=Aspergillus glaucus CBS 516.65 TaxID=1160497 RepID=A0A1L9VES8_ASPGL|nr:hypothetical protein ASPGLDRAFT_538626 [Aspergillus glaucus CBS 516.65]OJJ82420.1 hypothetical protein ASPGLDRAFT_538626 [Aspergillus glaucus CBS 516.65]
MTIPTTPKTTFTVSVEPVVLAPMELPLPSSPLTTLSRLVTWSRSLLRLSSRLNPVSLRWFATVAAAVVAMAVVTAVGVVAVVVAAVVVVVVVAAVVIVSLPPTLRRLLVTVVGKAIMMPSSVIELVSHCHLGIILPLYCSPDFHSVTRRGRRSSMSR